ncbi:hypothetical protein Tco_1161335, partial [Tanacetum coccineum]
VNALEYLFQESLLGVQRGASVGQNDDVVQADDIQNEANELLKIRDFFSSSWLKRQVNVGNRYQQQQRYQILPKAGYGGGEM